MGSHVLTSTQTLTLFIYRILLTSVLRIWGPQTMPQKIAAWWSYLVVPSVNDQSMLSTFLKFNCSVHLAAFNVRKLNHLERQVVLITTPENDRFILHLQNASAILLFYNRSSKVSCKLFLLLHYSRVSWSSFKHSWPQCCRDRYEHESLECVVKLGPDEEPFACSSAGRICRCKQWPSEILTFFFASVYARLHRQKISFTRNYW